MRYGPTEAIHEELAQQENHLRACDQRLKGSRIEFHLNIFITSHLEWNVMELKQLDRLDVSNEKTIHTIAEKQTASRRSVPTTEQVTQIYLSYQCDMYRPPHKFTVVFYIFKIVTHQPLYKS